MREKFNTLPDYNLSRPLGKPKYKVIYEINNDDLINVDSFPRDTRVYETGELAVIQGHVGEHFSANGMHCYTFLGWSISKDSMWITYREDDEYTFKNKDLILYACWAKADTVSVDEDGSLSLKEEFKQRGIPIIRIPEYFYGIRVKKLADGAFAESDISTVIIPANISIIAGGAFMGWTGRTIHFVDSEDTLKYPALEICESAFYNARNLTNIILPYRWHIFYGNIFGGDNITGILRIYIRNTKEFIADKNQIDITEEDLDAELALENSGNYVREIYWGYND